MLRSLAPIALVSTLSLFAASTALAQEPAPAAPVAPQPPPAAPPAVVLPPPPALPGPAHAEPHGQRVTTTVESGDKNAVIERQVTTEETYGRAVIVLPFHVENKTWEQVCVAPCRVDLDPHSTYRVAKANDVPSTREFTLPPGTQALNLKVEPGNLVAHYIGTRMIAVGAAAVIVGGVLIPAASKFDDETPVRTAGIITGGAGLLFLAVGIPLAIASATHVTADDRKLARSAPKSGPKLGLGGLVF